MVGKTPGKNITDKRQKAWRKEKEKQKMVWVEVKLCQRWGEEMMTK